MQSMKWTHHGVFSVAVLLVMVASACGPDQQRSASEPVATSQTVTVIEGVGDQVDTTARQTTVESFEPRIVEVFEVSATFEDAVTALPLVVVGEIVSVGGAVEWNSKSGERWEYSEEAAERGRFPYEFQRVTIRVTEILKDEGGLADSLAPGQIANVIVPSRAAGGELLGGNVGSMETVGLRVLIVGLQREIKSEDGTTEQVVVAPPRSMYVELRSTSGAPTRAVRLWTAYSDRRTLASRGELSAAALDAMQYADAPEFSDLLARIPGADTRPREQHLGYDQVTQTTLPQPPPGTEP